MKTKKIKVAYILTPITFGGAEKVSLNFLRHVDRDRFDIRPILLTRPWEEETYFAQEILRLGYEYESVPVALYAKRRDALRVPRAVYRFYSIFKKDSFDLVHTHGYFADICGLSVARLLGIRTLSTCHGYVSNDRNLKIYNKLDKYALRLCATVIAVSQEIKSDLVRSGIKASKIAVIPNAATWSFKEDDLLERRYYKRLSFDIANDEFVIGYLGRLSKEKGVNYLVDAVSELRERVDKVKLLIVGEGQERESLEQRVKDEDLENMVLFAGFQEDIENWLPAFDVFVLPSLTEGTPMALLEAMTMGVPVIASRVGGIPSVVTDKINGLLCTPGNTKSIVDSILMLKNNYEIMKSLGKAGAETAKTEFNIDSWSKTIQKQYEDTHQLFLNDQTRA